VDTVLLLTVGFLLLPIALGRWSPGAIEGYGLLFVYVGYMMLTVKVALTN
jgi:Ca2+/Na+ antiporter